MVKNRSDAGWTLVGAIGVQRANGERVLTGSEARVRDRPPLAGRLLHPAHRLPPSLVLVPQHVAGPGAEADEIDLQLIVVRGRRSGSATATLADRRDRM